MITEAKEISNMEDIIDVRDIIERVEVLESELPPSDRSEGSDNLERQELATLQKLLDDLEGNGGDHEWNKSWYPVTLIRESHFQDYAQELAEDIGAISSEHSWPLGCIDWEQAANELLIDYSSVEFDGITYYYR